MLAYTIETGGCLWREGRSGGGGVGEEWEEEESFRRNPTLS